MHCGLQKLTLLDFPGFVACTVFSAGCNFRCPFCHNASLVNCPDQLPYSFEEVLDFLQKRSGILDGICLTGGEPLLCDEVLEVAAAARKLGFKVKLDTNGSFPEKLQMAVEKNLVDYVAMDIKSAPEKYAVICGKSDVLPAVEESIKFLQSQPLEFEFRTTVAGSLHEAADFARIGQWIGPVERYFLQPFADSGDILSGNAADYAVSDEFVQACLQEARKFVPNAAIRGR